MIVVIVNGYPKVGKTTFEKLCKKNNYNLSVDIFSTIDCIKDLAKICGWNGEKTPEHRRALSELKDFTSEVYDYPFKNICEKITNSKADVCFIDSREPSDIDRIKKQFDAITVLIDNPNIEEKFSNHADSNVKSYNYDITIMNDEDIYKLELLSIAFMKLMQKKERGII